jgi:hypothetical protein
MIAQMQGLRETYVAVHDAVTQALAQGVRSKPLFNGRTSAREALISYSRHLYRVVQGFPRVTAEQMSRLGVHVPPAEHRTGPAPTTAPLVAVVTVNRSTTGGGKPGGGFISSFSGGVGGLQADLWRQPLVIYY